MPEAKSSFHHLLGPGFPTRNFAKGKTIFQEGDRGDEFFIVVRGQVEIRSGDRLLETLEADGIFGEMALIDDSPRSATAVALTRRDARADQGKSVPLPGPEHAVLRAQRDARPRAPIAPPEQSDLSGAVLSQAPTARLNEDFNRLAALRRLDDAHRYRLAFEEAADVAGGERGAVDEHVPAKIVTGDESKAAASSNHFTLPVKSKAADGSTVERRGDRSMAVLVSTSTIRTTSAPRAPVRATTRTFAPEGRVWRPISRRAFRCRNASPPPSESSTKP